VGHDFIGMFMTGGEVPGGCDLPVANPDDPGDERREAPTPAFSLTRDAGSSMIAGRWSGQALQFEESQGIDDINWLPGPIT
jgi:hypothetical protein